MRRTAAVVPFALALSLTLGTGLPAQDPAAAAATGGATGAAPPSSCVPVQRTGDGAIARETELIRRAQTAPPTPCVFVGDSITQGWESTGKAAWAAQLAPLGALNLGNSGDRTEHVLWRLQQAPLTRLQPEHVVLLIGTNNLGHGTSTAEETLLGVQAVARLLVAQCPTATVHVLEIFPRGERFGPLRGDVCQINQALRAFGVAEAARVTAAGRTRARPPLAVHAIGDQFLAADGSLGKDVMPDFLHLSPMAYERWASALVAILKS